MRHTVHSEACTLAGDGVNGLRRADGVLAGTPVVDAVVRLPDKGHGLVRGELALVDVEVWRVDEVDVQGVILGIALVYWRRKQWRGRGGGGNTDLSDAACRRLGL